ncbi:MAG: AbrB/MazE/SpoVT family DNA-binding domain-containing protein [Gammaproteobacteria bacterium]|nr:AbrB/MazE/SpoVT family DNA-binding domain-containing protein [Gammaproteobacteria bacterium]
MTNHRAEVQIGAQGRMIIPTVLRKSMNLKPGDRLIARQSGDSLVLERRSDIEKRLLAMFAQASINTSLAAQLIAERRQEASTEPEPV